MVPRVLVIALLLVCLGACSDGGDAPPTPLAALVTTTPTTAPPTTTATPECAISPDTTHNANGHLLEGKRGGGMFIYPAAGRVFKANRPEKFLVFLAPLPASPPSPLLVHGRNRTTGTTVAFENARHLSEYGTEWGTNYLFHEPGCWELAVDEQGTRGMIVIAVVPLDQAG